MLISTQANRAKVACKPGEAINRPRRDPLRDRVSMLETMNMDREGPAHGAGPRLLVSRGLAPVWKSTTGLGGPNQTAELSISIKSKSIWLIFGRIDCSRRALEAKPKKLR